MLVLPQAEAVGGRGGAVLVSRGCDGISALLGRRISLTLVAAALPVLALAAGCGAAGENASGRPRVVTTLAIFADFARQVAGDRAGVVALLPAGADAHTFELEAADLARVARADIVFVNGLNLEEATLDAIEANLPSGAAPVVLSEGLTPIAGNPHLWLDVTYAMRYVERIRGALLEVDPEGAALYSANADSYLAELRELDGEIQAGIASIPPQRRKLVTFHDVFPYFARRYGLQVTAYVVRSPGREPSAAEVADLTRKIQDEEVPTVYKEPQFSARILELTARDAGVQVRELYTDSLSGEVDTYVEMMRYDLKQLEEGLGGP